jgi:hypothetical protein
VIQAKQRTIGRSELLRLMQSTSFKKILLIEPFEQADQKSLLDLLKRHGADEISIIVVVAP